MKLSLGIVGLPNVGKSTLFKALTKNDIVIANYPFATIDPNIGVVAVPDERLDKLEVLSKSKKKIPAVVEFYDIAGLVKGASQGEGLGNQFLSHIKETQAIVHVIRAFPSSEIIHVEETTDPVRDMEIIIAELQLKDLETVERRLKSVDGEAKTGKKDAVHESVILTEAKHKLERGEMLQDFAVDPAVKNLNLLTAKAMIVLVNGSEADVPEVLKQKIAALGSPYVVADLANTDFDLQPLIREAYRTLGLISFFTTGEDETRAWTITRGEKAPEAAGAIHSDFEKKFIRADVIQWDKLIEAGGWVGAKQKGLMRAEGKEYIVEDGDVMEIKHS